VAVLFGLLLGLRFGDARLWLIAAVMLPAQFSISALNDWADAELDARAGRSRPIGLRLMSRSAAGISAVALGLVSVAVSVVAGFGLGATLILAAGLACGWLYDLLLKRTALSFLPFAIAFPLMAIWVAVIANQPAGSFPVIVLGGVPLAIAIHLADAIPDREHDAEAGVRTLAVVLGRPAGEVVAAVLMLAGSGVATYTVMHRGAVSIGALALVGLAINYLNLSFTKGDAPWSRFRPVLAKWNLICGAIFAALLLVLSA
jgi:4-hydroxybenzoate polyprenyltransferase